MDDHQYSARTGNPKLSICIATYNRGKFIGETLDSILGQLVPGVELIVVDGASPDNTSEVMVRYLSCHPEIRYYREQVNSGVDGDYDKAVGYATGEYCWLMTDDDLLKPDAISRVLEFIDGTLDLVIVNAEVRSADFSKILRQKFIRFSGDKEYGAKDSEKFFSDVASCLSFIGCVVIRRNLWLMRDRSSYYGTLFVHVGVIFQHPPIARVRVIADPLITIRYGNAMWSARGFEIWLFKWPRLIWSFDDFSDQAKALVCPREPWERIDKLILYRAMGAYALADYRNLFSGGAYGLSRVIPFVIATIPVFMANLFVSLYCVLVHRKASITIHDLARSQHATWASRLAARILNA